MIFPPGRLYQHTSLAGSVRGFGNSESATLRARVRIKEERQPEATAGIIDSQSVKTTEKGGNVVTMQAKRSSFLYKQPLKLTDKNPEFINEVISQIRFATNAEP